MTDPAVHQGNTATKGASILQVLPSMGQGGVERGAYDVALALVAAGRRAVVASNGGPYAEALAGRGALHVKLPVHSKNPLVMYRNIGRLAKLAQRENAGLIHARSRAPAWSAYYAARRLGLPFVTTFHGTYNFNGRLKRGYNAIMTRGDRVIAISEFIAAHMKAHYRVNPARIRVVPRGIDMAFFDPARLPPDQVAARADAWGLDPGRPTVMLPGRLTRWKGHAVLIEALRWLGRPDVQCVMVGDGRDGYREEMEALAQRNDVAAQVRFVGGSNDMPTAYALADVVVSASTDPEAFGRVSVEAQAMGCPLVASDHGGSTETVIDRSADPMQWTGWLTPPGDAEALAAALAEALAMPAEARMSYADRARRHVARNFTRDLMCARVLAVYDEVLGG